MRDDAHSIHSCEITNKREHNKPLRHRAAIQAVGSQRFAALLAQMAILIAVLAGVVWAPVAFSQTPPGPPASVEPNLITDRVAARFLESSSRRHCAPHFGNPPALRRESDCLSQRNKERHLSR